MDRRARTECAEEKTTGGGGSGGFNTRGPEGKPYARFIPLAKNGSTTISTYHAFRLTNGPLQASFHVYRKGRYNKPGLLTHCVVDWAPTPLQMSSHSTQSHSLTARQSGCRHNYTRVTHRGTSSGETSLNHPGATARTYPH